MKINVIRLRDEAFYEQNTYMKRGIYISDKDYIFWREVVMICELSFQTPVELVYDSGFINGIEINSFPKFDVVCMLNDLLFKLGLEIDNDVYIIKFENGFLEFTRTKCID